MNLSTMPTHQKHAKLVRPTSGYFARNEWSIIGTPCSEIDKIVAHLIERLSPQYRLSYIDADHQASKGEGDFLQKGAAVTYTDKINYRQWNEIDTPNSFDFKQKLVTTDLAIINGNHFKASRQIVCIDDRKKDSLHRKLDRLTAVDFFVLMPGQETVFDFLKDHIAEWKNIPVIKLEELNRIVEFLKNALQKNIPTLCGLVLAGGKSTRMGEDKGLITYHGKPQREFVFDMLSEYCEQTFYSFRESGTVNYSKQITDTFTGLGPFGAILSAFRANPNTAWLVVACDLPLLDKKTIEVLISQRNPSKFATAFYNPDTKFPEPLITIFEPRSYPRLLHFLSEGYSCPRKMLINSDIEIIKMIDTAFLQNVNNPEDKKAIQEKLS